MEHRRELTVEIDELGSAVHDIISWVKVMEHRFGVIDQRLDELDDYWGGTDQREFRKKALKLREQKNARLKAALALCDSALCKIVPTYEELDDLISETQKLLV